jgi:DNA-binding Lrp family transcriptional regulator
MAVVKKINDSIRVKILSAMMKKGSVTPNVRQIKKITGFHRATIKSSIDFLENKKFINGYRPLLDPVIAGYNLKSFSYFQIDLSLKEKQKQFFESVSKDKNVFAASQVISEGDFNIALSFLSKNIESQHNSLREKYIYKIPNYYDFIKKSSSYYLSNPIYKAKNQIDTLIELLLEEQGLD